MVIWTHFWKIKGIVIISYKWSYHLNPKKSAIIVYGEYKSEQKLNSKYRIFRLGQNQIKEQNSYDQQGLKNSTDLTSSEGIGLWWSQ